MTHVSVGVRYILGLFYTLLVLVDLSTIHTSIPNPQQLYSMEIWYRSKCGLLHTSQTPRPPLSTTTTTLPHIDHTQPISRDFQPIHHQSWPWPVCHKRYLGNQTSSVRGQGFQVVFLSRLSFPLVPLWRKERKTSKRGISRGWHAHKCTDTHLWKYTHTQTYVLTLILDTRTLTRVLNALLSIRANGIEHLYFIISALILPHLNVSPSIMVTHHFHSNPPKEMNRNFCLSRSFLLHHNTPISVRTWVIHQYGCCHVAHKDATFKQNSNTRWFLHWCMSLCCRVTKITSAAMFALIGIWFDVNMCIYVCLSFHTDILKSIKHIY